MQTLADPDTLAARCRDPNAQRLVREAVAAYHVGAHRAAIVSTWIAVVYDVFGKIKELAIADDPEAKIYVEALDATISSADYGRAQKLEAAILEEAALREMITPDERADLERLYADRHRCAHPSMSSIEVAYAPSPELVRLHLRNAVEHLLSHPPTQGKAALARLFATVENESFPVDAEAFFRGSAFARAKQSLVRNFCAATTKSLLNEGELEAGKRARRLRALKAFRNVHRLHADGYLREQFRVTVGNVSDQNIPHLIELVAVLDEGVALLPPDVELRVRTWLASAQTAKAPAAVEHAMKVHAWRSLALSTLAGTDLVGLRMLLGLAPRPEYLERAIQLFLGTADPFDADDVADAVLRPYAKWLEEEQITRLLVGLARNPEVCFSPSDLLRTLYLTSRTVALELDAAIEATGATRSIVRRRG